MKKHVVLPLLMSQQVTAEVHPRLEAQFNSALALLVFIESVCLASITFPYQLFRC